MSSQSCGRLRFGRMEGAYQSIEAELEKALKLNCFFSYGFHPHLRCEVVSEKTIEEIVMVHSEDLGISSVEILLTGVF